MKAATVLVLVTLITMEMDKAYTLSSHRELQKPGACPKLSLNTVGTCNEICSGDESCPGKMKCCSNGCGYVCMNPVFKMADSHVKDGFDTYKHN
ncbi:WAP four-disulfide core domain protein 18-like [Peromyscus californicus insignis]|uniref:WAP four-disulfide core domain protein 18-like n=1 Tax=Peromyscus californicus insignis TaxID=564181 RepID=UPI0022A7CB74|nr:WAP four-disulfide core domain protein 18-like [Peromyscus californicus insignis]